MNPLTPIQRVLSFGIALSLGLSTNAQQLEMPDNASILRTAHGASVLDGQVFMAGPDYRASFDEHGIEFIPALGRRAPTAMPLRFRVESASRGSTTERLRACPPELRRDRVTFARHPSIRERFDSRAAGVELSYVFDRAIGKSGDLIVRGRIETDLVGRDGATHDGLEFVAADLPGGGGVTIGKVTGIGADGSRAEGSLRLSGDTLELVLPAAFVDSASYPLVLDPLISGLGGISTSGANDDKFVDVAWNGTTDRYLVVWQRILAADNIDIRAQRVLFGGASNGGLELLAGSGVNLFPQVGNTATLDQFVVVWQFGNNFLGPFDLRARAVSATPGFVSGPVAVSNSFGENDLSPVVGGSPDASGGDAATVVWNSVGNGIRGVTVTPTASGLPIVSSVVSITTNSNDRSPSISSSSGTNDNHLIAWHRLGNVRAQVWRDDLSLALSGILNVASGDNPAVDGDGHEFVIAFERFEGGSTTSRDIHARTLQFLGGGLTTQQAAVAIATDVGQNEFDPAVCYLGNKALIAWTDRGSSFLDSTVRMRTIDPRNGTQCGLEQGLGLAGTSSIRPAMASQLSDNTQSDDCILVFATADTTAPFEGDVRFGLFSAVGSGGSITDLGGGCGASGAFTITGIPAVSESLTLDVINIDPVTPVGALHIGLPGPLIPCGTCLIVNPIIAIAFAPVGGQFTLPLSLGCSPGIINATLDFQYVFALTPTSPCSVAPTAAFTRILQVQIGL